MDKATLQKLRRDPVAFREALTIDVDGIPRHLADVMDDWQREDFEALDNGWCRAVGLPPIHPDRPTYLRGYHQRPRGHDKTGGLAVCSVWALFSSGRKLQGVACGADQGQAKLLRDAIERLVRLNLWLTDFLDVQSYRVVNKHTGSTLEILSSDVASSWGILPDFIVVDELANWEASGEDFWASMASAAAKRANCMLVVISNAGLGMGSSWQWNVWEACQQSDAWYVSHLDGPVASWITEDRLAEQRAILPPKVYQRIWLNQWTTGGDALDIESIKECIDLESPPGPDHPAWHSYVSDGDFIAGLDLSTRKDHAGLCVLKILRRATLSTNRLQLAFTQRWQPMAGKVDLLAVREGVHEAHRMYRFHSLYYDPFQAELMAQELRQVGVPMIEYAFTPANCNTMASKLLETFRSRQISLYRCDDLIKDLSRISIVEKSFGWKLTAPKSASEGHCDLGFSFCIALPHALHEMNEYQTEVVDTPCWRSNDYDPNYRPFHTMGGVYYH